MTVAAVPRCLATRSGRWERPTSGQEDAHAAVLLRFRLLKVRNPAKGAVATCATEA